MYSSAFAINQLRSGHTLSSKRLVIAVIVVGLVVAFFAFDLGRYFSLEYLKAQQANIMAYYEAHRWRTVFIYFLIYVAVTGLSLPGAAVMTLVGGALFGLLWGTIIVSFASSLEPSSSKDCC